MNRIKIRIGHSPDADDAFMFYGLISGKVKLEDIDIEYILKDIQTLNEYALKGDLEMTAISAHTYPYVADKYWIMSTGASMGKGYGPILISKKYSTMNELKGKKIATPGKLTTASLIFKIFYKEMENIDIPFDQIMGKVESGEFDAGLLIHEGQVTYREMGFNKILDLGTLWKERFGDLPLPLGIDIIRKDVGKNIALELNMALRQSIQCAFENSEEAMSYAIKFGRNLDKKLGDRFIRMYVNDLTINMGEKGKLALEKLFEAGYNLKLIPKVKNICII